MVLDSPSSLRNWKTNFFFVSGDCWEFISGEGLDDAPKLLRSWGTPVSGASSSLFYSYTLNSLDVRDADVIIFIFCSFHSPSFEKEVLHSC